MGKVYLGWPNRLTDSGATLTGGSWLAALPLSNVLDRCPSVIARSSDADTASTQFDLTLATERVLRSFALVNHTLSQNATWRIKLGTSLGASDVFDSGALPVWRLNFNNDLLEWESDGWWEGSYDDDFVGHPFAAIYLAPQELSARYLRIEINDTANPAGYIQIGRLFAGGGISPEYGMAYGASDQWEDSSVIEASIGGSEYFDARRRCRVARFAIEAINQTTEFRQFYEMQRRLGTTGEVLYLPNDSDLSASQLTGFVGRLRQLSAIEYPFYLHRRCGFEVKELL